MANLRVALVWLCKTERGWRRYPAVIGKNGRVKAGVIIVDGVERKYPQGRFQIRTYEGTRMIYRDAGDSAAAAMTSKIKAEHLLEAKAAAKKAGAQVIDDDAPGRLSLARELNRFIEAAQDRGSNVAATVYKLAGADFLKITGRVYADEVTADDLLKHQRELRKRGESPRTIYNRHGAVVSFLRFLKLDVKTLAPRNPRFEQKVPQAYSQQELRKFFDAIKDEHTRLTFELLLKTGLREREAVYLYWDDIDFAKAVLHVRSKPSLGFTIKDKEQRDVPIPVDLLSRLRSYRAQHPDVKFVTGTSTDRPNGKLLRTLKRLVNRAGLACGQCDGCRDHNECSRWILHRFRATCITRLLQSGIDLRTTMRFSGHSDLASVMRYLSPAEDESITARVNAVTWM